MGKEDLTSIIIPTYNALGLVSRCVDSIRKYTRVPYEIIIVDNGSTDGTAEYCVQQALRFVSLPANSGFPAACNKGLAVSSGEQLMLLNNDCMAAPGWLPQMLSALYSSPDIGIVGPVTNYASGRQRIDAGPGGPEELLAYAAGHNRPDASKWREVKRLVGFCFLFKRSLYERIGPLDEGFSPGHYEDDDYCYRAIRKGYRLLICGDTFVYHQGSASFTSQHPEGWQDLIQRNRQRFIEKWGCDPLSFM
ncbi:glycosyl transferase [Paenibacillus physcomitrellae]|uniref:Glycosyl transferase n=2 Tax=Paenibacillus physcomitrellae TaxID=1619311 RepID=A0ABQ1G2E9_9BACL|nr:glycosyl transferase [Paenibacillus physcomitrellae]